MADNSGECGSSTDRPPVYLHQRILLVQTVSESGPVRDLMSGTDDDGTRHCAVLFHARLFPFRSALIGRSVFSAS